ncbi:MAG: HAMP domain-containing histidine kinase [Planctomycetota bacterium]|nr:MAG: HAMP domain-containing histidine kinase [Planctomycetota bacterium]
MVGARLRWLWFALAAAALAYGLAQVSLRALANEHVNNESRVFWARQRLLQLALWRMDAALAPLVATEAARPTYHYTSFYREREPITPTFEPLAQGGVLLPSPLLTATREENESLVTLHFQIGPDGRWTSPRLPDGIERQFALRRGYVAPEELRVTLERLSALEKRYSAEQFLTVAARSPAEAALALRGADATSTGTDDYAVRNQSLQRALSQVAISNYAQSGVEPPAVTASPLLPTFQRDLRGGAPELFLVREVDVGGARFVQGLWAEWAPSRAWLLAQVRDLLGEAVFAGATADLVPTPPGGARELVGDARDALTGSLASVPCTLVLRGLVPPVIDGPTSTEVTLIVAWVVVLAAIVAFAFVLRAALELSERRGEFVSAVTHELRTPLTTFCLYSEMLADGMVRDPTAQHEYLVTLKHESSRLRRIVESVLAYARLEDGRSKARPAPIGLDELLDASRPALSRRASESGFELVITRHASDGDEAHAVEVDPQSFEQVLFNLVDNACKYAHAATDRRLLLDASIDGAHWVLDFADHGPGIPTGTEREIFQAFRRATGADDARIPGLGLGLSLARGLARQMGGELALLPGPGARFRFSLPLAHAHPAPRAEP